MMHAFKCRVVERILVEMVNSICYLVNRPPSIPFNYKILEKVYMF